MDAIAIAACNRNHHLNCLRLAGISWAQRHGTNHGATQALGAWLMSEAFPAYAHILKRFSGIMVAEKFTEGYNAIARQRAG